jgi:uncharacterized tellurite resistance protein B-like protein
MGEIENSDVSDQPPIPALGSELMEPLQLLRNLMIMATADGRLADEELRWLRERQSAWNITADQFEEALQYAQSGQARLELPELPSERYDLLYDLVALMSVDSDFDPMEMNLFAVIAARLEVSEAELNALLAEFTGDEDELILGDED